MPYPPPIRSTISGCLYNLPAPNLPNIARVDTGCLPMLDTMMSTGILLDIPHIQETTQIALAQEQAEIEKIHSITGHRINPESGDQVAGLLYGELGFHELLPKPPKMTASKKRMTTDDQTLAAMRVQFTGMGLTDCLELVNAITAAREANTIRTMFSEPLAEYGQRSPDGRIRPTLKYTRTKTGRLACEAPNLQNIPVRSKLGKRIRQAFIGADGRKLVSCDYAQIEMRMAAHMSGDDVLSDLIWGGADIHTMTAAAIFRIPPEQVNKIQRLVCKTLGFAILYGVTPEGLQEQIFAAGGPYWEVAQCTALIESWFSRYARVWGWVCEQEARAVRYGCTWDMWGRPKLVPEGLCKVERIRDRGFRECGNQPLQGGAQGILKVAMAEIAPILEHYSGLGYCRPLLQIHDELLFEVDSAMAEDFAADTRAGMAQTVTLEVPVDASSDVGDRWGDLK